MFPVWEAAEAPLERTGGLRISRETGDRLWWVSGQEVWENE